MASLSGCNKISEIHKYRNLSPLEQLPTEIIEHVYEFVLADQNTLHKALSLPKSSPFIGLRLGSLQIKEELVIRAFGKCMIGDHPLLSDIILNRVGLQEELLKLDWVTWKLIVRCQKQTFLYVLQNLRKRLRSINEYRPFFDRAIKIMQSRTKAERGHCLGIDWHTDMKVIYYRFDAFGYRDREKISRRSPDNNLVFCMPHFITKLIPHRLLKGPLSEERIALLAGLDSFGCSCVLRRDQALVRRTVVRAIREGNGLALKYLLHIRIAKADQGPKVFNSCEYVTATFDQFRIAILEAGCQLDIVDKLLEGRLQGFARRETDKIKKWITEKRGMIDPEWKGIIEGLEELWRLSQIEYRPDLAVAYKFW